MPGVLSVTLSHSVLWPVGGAEDAATSCHSESELSLDLEVLCFRFFFFFFSFFRFLCFSFFFFLLRFSLSPEELELLSSSSEVESSSNCFNCWILDRATRAAVSSGSRGTNCLAKTSLCPFHCPKHLCLLPRPP